jgi:putative exosortase-associated protein (TIGR04073 family)
MKLPVLIAVSLLVGASFVMADIQAPPASEYGPTRKLGRGISNIAFGSTEIINSWANVNFTEGNSAAWSYGLVRGVGRAFARLGYGVYETVLFPIPTYKGSYRPPYRSDIPWLQAGYAEFPPELGFETRYDYSRSYAADPSL